MSDSNRLACFRLISGARGIKTGLMVALSKEAAINTFCRLYLLDPHQVVVLCVFPLGSIWRVAQ